MLHCFKCSGPFTSNIVNTLLLECFSVHQLQSGLLKVVLSDHIPLFILILICTCTIAFILTICIQKCIVMVKGCTIVLYSHMSNITDHE